MKELGWTGAGAPRREVLDGRLVRLEPLDPGRHADQLFAAAKGADETWTYLPYGPFAGKDEFSDWLAERAPVNDPLTFTIMDRERNSAGGLASFMSIVPDHGVIEIGHIWLSPQLQRTRQATEAIYVMARHAFEDLGNRRLEWKCDALNIASRRAAERFGFLFEGQFRQHRVVKDRNRDTAWYSIIDVEWPSRKAAFDAWLAPDNFDESGRQRLSLSRIREGIQSGAR